MSPEHWHAIIVGQGLAGTTLALTLQTAGWRVLLIDADEVVTSSKIAAGHITPITGQRMVFAPNFDAFFSAAQAFYRDFEARTGEAVFYERRMLRLFKSEQEKQRWAGRRHLPALQPFLADPRSEIVLDPLLVDAPHGGFEMRGAQLDVANYLLAARKVLPVMAERLDWHCDVHISQTDVQVLSHRADIVISCEGYAASRNPYVSFVPFIAAKGDILTVRFHEPVPHVSIHCGIWIAPTANADIFKVGSTYDLTHLDEVPTSSARQELESKLQSFFRIPYTVLDQQAAVRPIIHVSDAVVGLHPQHPRLGFFNGLGSKGALLAPFMARLFREFLVDGKPLPSVFDLRQRFAG